MARDIALIEPDPVDWAGWVTYLLDQIEGKARRPGRITDFNEMLESLKNHLAD